MTQRRFTRRTVLVAASALPLATAVTPSFAKAPMLGASGASYNRFKLGEFEITTLLSSTLTVPDPHAIFGLNVSTEEFAKASLRANIPTDRAKFFFTPTIVNTGSDLILFDTGRGPSDIVSALSAAGYTPEQIDVVVITHMHGDHIGGLADDGVATFPNARYATGRVEFDAWSTMESEGFNTLMRPFAEQTTMLEGGQPVTSGITAMAAYGHTPGHMTYMLESGGKSLIIGADFANHYIWSLAHPDWEVKFDMDKEAAAKSRRQLLEMMSGDRIPFIGYHMPWPASGYVEAVHGGFRYVPTSYQLTL